MEGCEFMNFDKLKGVMREKKITQNDLAKRLRISIQALNSKLNNRSSFTLEEIQEIIIYLEIKNIKEIFFGNSVPNMQ